MLSYLNETLGELQHKVLILGNAELLSPDGQKIVILYKIVGSCTRQKYGFSDYTGCLLLSHPLSQDHTVIFKEFRLFPHWYHRLQQYSTMLLSFTQFFKIEML
jgi:hypothetical protein